MAQILAPNDQSGITTRSALAIEHQQVTLAYVEEVSGLIFVLKGLVISPVRDVKALLDPGGAVPSM